MSAPLAAIGHNHPPSPLASAGEAFTELRTWLSDHPVITSVADSKQGAAYIERTRIALGELETDRKAKVDPINAELREVNAAYKTAREPLENALKHLRKIMTDYATAVEAARIAEANRLREEAEAAARAAQTAAFQRDEAIENAQVGEAADVGGLIADAATVAKEAGKLDRKAAVAEHSVPVRVNSIMGGKALAMRTRRVLVVTDATKAYQAIKQNAPLLAQRIEDTIRICAEKFEDDIGALPAGVEERFERSM